MSVDPRSDRPIYRQVADILRAQIEDGALTPGAMLPGEKTLAETYAVGRDAVRKAIAILRSEGRVTTARGERTRVRAESERQPLVLGPGDVAIARMPTDRERATLGLEDGSPVIALTELQGAEHLFPAHSYFLTTRPVSEAP